jgi:hypothetical protein
MAWVPALGIVGGFGEVEVVEEGVGGSRSVIVSWIGGVSDRGDGASGQRRA